MHTELQTLRAKLAEPAGVMISGHFLVAALSDVLAMVDQIAAMRTDDEIQDGMSGDDAAETIGSLVTWARRLSDCRPDPSTVYVHPDIADELAPATVSAPLGRPMASCRCGNPACAQNLSPDGSFDDAWRRIHHAGPSDPFPMKAPPPAGPDCSTCNGTGEIVEYPPDDDERLVACPACGGTGEAIR